jgi:uncharacterized protein
MARLLALAALGFAAYALVRYWRRRHRTANGSAGAPVKMLACAHCGVFVPEPNAVRDGARWYCSEAHRRVARPRDE